VLDHFVARADPAVIGTCTTFGMRFNDYFTYNVDIKNADIQGAYVGIDPSSDTGGSTFTIEHSYLQNYIDVKLEPLWTSGDNPNILGTRKVVIANVQFANLSIASNWGAQLTIERDFSGIVGGVLNLRQLDQVYVYNYNNVTGDNFQVYFAGQAANAIYQQSSYDSGGAILVLASPVAGLTNQQTWDQYGIALAGVVAPVTATTRGGVAGLVCPF
jgi:hypothetical protein